MYRRTESQLQLFEDFFLPFGGKLNKNNRWVQLASMIPWWRAEEKYAKSLKKSMQGQVPLSVRIALGALYIQERMQLDDRETVQQITENPYYQYFLGLPEFQDEPPFHHSLMTHFRKSTIGFWKMKPHVTSRIRVILQILQPVAMVPVKHPMIQAKSNRKTKVP